MSLLWRTAVWWNADPDDVYDYEEGLRDPEEAPKARGQRYVSQVVDRHNVSRGAAQKAIQHVMAHHADDDHQTRSPMEYGFASAAQQWKHYDAKTSRTLMDPATWRGRKVEQVPLNQPIHATQDFIRPKSVAHNLFHPGKKQPDFEEDAVGDPDHDPDWSRDEEEWHEAGGETPEERELHKNVYFMRRNNGRMEVVDGHHRVAADMLLGKSHTPGLVIHERDLANPTARASDGPALPKDDLRKHMVEHHGIEDWALPGPGEHDSTPEWHDAMHADPGTYGQATHRHARRQPRKLGANDGVRMVPVKEVMSYQPTDFPTWEQVHDNFHWDHPTMRNFVRHIGQHGVKKPIRVDYENDPPTVENGHTRALAAAKAGLTHIPVKQYEWPGDIDEDDREGYGG